MSEINVDEWLSQASEEAKEQFNKPLDWFKQNVKCCYNCIWWLKDSSLMFEYAYNSCMEAKFDTKTVEFTPWDAYCDKYNGSRTEENLLDFAHIDWEKDD